MHIYIGWDIWQLSSVHRLQIDIWEVYCSDYKTTFLPDWRMVAQVRIQKKQDALYVDSLQVDSYIGVQPTGKQSMFDIDAYSKEERCCQLACVSIVITPPAGKYRHSES